MTLTRLIGPGIPQNLMLYTNTISAIVLELQQNHHDCTIKMTAILNLTGIWYCTLRNPKPHILSMNKHCIIISFEVIGQNVKIAQSRWPLGSHLKYDINRNFISPLNQAYTKTLYTVHEQTLCHQLFWNYSPECQDCQIKMAIRRPF